MDFYKYHALGNDYIIIDPQKNKIKLNEDNIRLICHRNFGLGSDGILYGPEFSDEKLMLRIYNPDGSEAEKSGNGLRMFSKFLIDMKYVSSPEFSIYTPSGESKVEVLKEKPLLIKIDMGIPTFVSNKIPVSGAVREVVNEELIINGSGYNITCVSVGNPHCVIPLNEISSELVKEIGPLVEKNELFPNRINLQILKVRDRANIEIEIWERGAGYTLASGSSSSAAACAAYKLGLVGRKIKVHMPGGVLDIETGDDGRVQMTGTASSVACGNFTEEMLSNFV
ncbi:MAG: diaminopimelate epimerase [Spirochaetes bacterium]|nr:diaminopimelate epimerase [Spirochaetota bacterium]